MTLAGLNALPAGEARTALARCCGSSAWVQRMVARRPFLTVPHLLGIGYAFWFGLGPEDWREAFAHHPRVGDLASLRSRFASPTDLAAREQARVAEGSREVLEALAEGNRAYQERFGYIFIVFASGLAAEEVLALLRDRQANDAETELQIAAKEQWKIMRLRLDKMLGGPR